MRLVYAISNSKYGRRLSHPLSHKPAKVSVFLGFCIISSQKIINNTMKKYSLFRFLHPPGVNKLTLPFSARQNIILIPLVNTVPLRTFWNWKVRVHINFTLRGAGWEILRALQRLVGSLMNFIKLSVAMFSERLLSFQPDTSCYQSDAPDRVQGSATHYNTLPKQLLYLRFEC